MRAATVGCSRPRLALRIGQVDKKSLSPNGSGAGRRAGGGGGFEGEGGDSAGDGLAANVSRQPSLRQQEKAPEGRAPHVQDTAEASAADTNVDQSTEVAHDEWDEDDAAHGESRFTEGL